MISAIECMNIQKIYRNKIWKSFIPPKWNYKLVKALDGINLSIKHGELFGLLGPNGAGKTTLVGILSGLLKADGGNAYVLGYDVDKESKKVQMNIGVVSGGQERQLYQQLTAQENLEFFGNLYNLSGQELKKRIDYLLEIIGLADKKNDLVSRFSLGMKQKLSFAKALIHDPKILILDEPTIGLDPIAARAVREFIKIQLTKNEKKTILLTTHYMYEADYLCDRIAIIDRGRIIAEGTPEELKKQVQKNEIVEVIVGGIINKEIKQILRKSEFIQGVTMELFNGNTQAKLRVVSKNNESIISELVDLLVKKLGLKIFNISLQKPTLEDVFIKLTGKGLKNGMVSEK